MKKVTSFKSIVLGLSMFSLVLGSCSSDDNSLIIISDPVKVGDVQGEYVGKMAIEEGEAVREVEVDFSVQDSLLTFSDFPVDELKAKLVEAEVLSVAVLEEESTEKVGYVLGIESKLTENPNLLELVMTAEPLVMQITDGDAVKEVEVIFEVKESGVYVGTEKTVSFEVIAKSLKVNGEEKEDALSVSYKVVRFLKK